MLFGTDGIRGRVGQFPLDAKTLQVIGQAIGLQLKGKIIFGQDTRESSPWILDRLKEGLQLTEATMEDTGVLPTPAIALLTQRSGVSGGVMISASHNPYHDNGIKVFSENGRKLADQEENQLEQRITALLPVERPDKTETNGKSSTPALSSSPWSNRYLELLKTRFRQGEWLSGLRIVTDCANGAMSEVAPKVLRGMGAEVFEINAEPSGTNINEGCGAVHPSDMIKMAKRKKADLSVAFDGDGDRAIFASKTGKLVDGDAVLLLMARVMKLQTLLDPPSVIGTSMTNYSLERMFSEEGIELMRTSVGDRYVFQKMMDSGSVLGGEPSGHIIFSDFGLSGDGLLTTLKVCEALVSQDASLDELLSDWRPAPQLLEGIPVEMKFPLDAMPVVGIKIDEIARDLEGRGRIVVRYSGTEPLLRVMIESDSAQKNDALAAELIVVIRRELLLAAQTDCK